MTDEQIDGVARAIGLALARPSTRRRVAWYWRKDAARIAGGADADLVEEERERDRRVARAAIAEITKIQGETA